MASEPIGAALSEIESLDVVIAIRSRIRVEQ